MYTVYIPMYSQFPYILDVWIIDNLSIKTDYLIMNYLLGCEGIVLFFFNVLFLTVDIFRMRLL